MKLDMRVIFWSAFAWLMAYFLLLWMATSCTPEYHLNKFYKKGGKVECDTTTLMKRDTLYIDGDTIIVDRPITKVEIRTEYKTRWQTRYEYKRFRDTLRLIEYKTKVEYKYRTREAKNDLKTNPLRQVKGMIFWAVLIVIGLFVYNWISKR